MIGTAPTAQPWPELPYEAFAPTMHLLHMGLQMVGKLTLLKPFEPQWANVVLGLTSRGLTTGPVPWQGGTFTVDADFGAHEIGVSTSWGAAGGFALAPMSVAAWHDRFFAALGDAGVAATINEKPQEVADPIPFPAGHGAAPLRPRARGGLVPGAAVLRRRHAALPRLLRRQDPADRLHVGHVRPARRPPGWHGGPADRCRRRVHTPQRHERRPGRGRLVAGQPRLPAAAYYSFTHPRPAGIETVDPRPAAARWDSSMGEFLLDYDDVRASGDPEAALLAFLDSTYEAGATKAGWDPAWICSGRPEPAPQGETT